MILGFSSPLTISLSLLILEVPLLPSSTPASLKKPSDYKETLVIIVAVVLSSVCLLFAIFLIWICTRRRKRQGKADLTGEMNNSDMLLPGTPNSSSNIPPVRPKQRVRLQSNLSQVLLQEAVWPKKVIQFEMKSLNLRLLDSLNHEKLHIFFFA